MLSKWRTMGARTHQIDLPWSRWYPDPPSPFLQLAVPAPPSSSLQLTLPAPPSSSLQLTLPAPPSSSLQLAVPAPRPFIPCRWQCPAPPSPFLQVVVPGPSLPVPAAECTLPPLPCPGGGDTMPLVVVHPPGPALKPQTTGGKCGAPEGRSKAAYTASSTTKPCLGFRV